MSGYIGVQPVPQTTQTRQSFTATAGQTSFGTSGYQAGFLDVYLNGVKLAAADYTASNGSDVVLGAGAAVNDILEIVAFETFTVSDGSFSGTTTIETLTVTNDGAGSSLDADQLDGQHGAYYTTYTDTATATKLPLAGGTMSGEIAMGTSKITGAGNPTSAQDLATKAYVDGASGVALPLSGGALTGAVTTNSTFDGRDVAADGVLATNALPKSGGALTGAVTTNSTIDGRDVAADGVLATNALPKAGGAVTGNVTFGDSNKIVMGAGSDLNVFHNGSHSYVQDSGTGNLYLAGSNVIISNPTSSETMAYFDDDGGASLWYNNAVKIATTNTGVAVTGNIANTSGDLTLDVAGDIILDAAGSDILLKAAGTTFGSLRENNSNFRIKSDVSNKDIVFVGVDSDGGGEINALTLDMSAAGRAIFSAGATLNGSFNLNSSSYDNRQLGMDSQGFFIYNVADSAYDLKLSDSGYATLRNGLTASALNVTGQQSGDYLAKLTSTNSFGLRVKTTSTSDAHEQFAIFNGSNAISFKVMGGGTVHASGINLGGSGAANRLDDYEEGNHAPQKANGGTVSYGSGTNGHYTKVGELVTYYMDMSISGASGESGSWAVTLPFAAKAGNNYMAFLPWIVDTGYTGSSETANGFVNGGASVMFGYKITSGNSSGAGYINNNVTGRWSGVFTYFAA